MRIFSINRGYRTQNVTLTISATALITLGMYDRTIVVPGLMVGQVCRIEPRGAIPTGYALHNCWCATAGVLTVRMTNPLIAALQTINLPCVLTVFE